MKNLFVPGVCIILFFSCNNEDGSLPSNIPSKVYFPLMAGNYWVYQHYKLDPSGNEVQTEQTDSIVITRDSLIRGKLYYVLEGTDYPFIYPERGIIDMVRDSAGYLVNHNGIILCSVANFSDTLATRTEIAEGDTVYVLTCKMEKQYNPVLVPAGIFEAINYRGTVQTSRVIPGVSYPRYLNTYYAGNVGKILGTYFYIHTPEIYEKRLIRYRVAY